MLSEVLPPVVYRGIQRAWRASRGLPGHVFEGCYPDFESVPTTASYDDDEIAESIVTAAMKKPANGPMVDASGQLLLPAIVSGYKSPTVLDFGGGPMRGLRNIRAYAGSDLKYILVETPSVCRAFRCSLPDVEVLSEIPAELSSPLIVNAAGAIQYISSYSDVLKRLTHLRPEALIVSQVPLSDLATYARLQLNIPGKRIAQWVFNRAGFVAEMADLDYRLTFAVDHNLPPVHLKAPGPSTISSMIFRPAVDKS